MKETKRNISFALVVYNQDKKSEKLLSDLFKYSDKYNAAIDTIESIYIKIIFGLFDDNEKSPAMQRKEFINNIPLGIKKKCSIVHGDCRCYIGNIGAEQRWNYTADLPDFKYKLKTLLNLQPSEIIEI